jgi:micrococcal nuclease
MGQCLRVVEAVATSEESRVSLSKIDPNGVNDVLFKDEVIKVFALEVTDGDTVAILINVGKCIWKTSVRLRGIDTPEMKAGKDRLPEEKIAAQKARAFLQSLIPPSTYQQICIKDRDKYGRLLADIILSNGKNVSEVMVKNGYARVYDGTKKADWTLAELTSGPYR